MLFALCLHVVRGTNSPVLRTDNGANPTTYQNTSVWRKLQRSIGVRFCLHLLLMCPSQSSLPAKPPPCPVFPDCYHNSLALYHQNISSYLLSKNSCFLSAVSFYIMKGENKCHAFIGAIWVWYHSKEISHTIPSCVDCFLVATGFILAKFFVIFWKVLIPLLIL